MSSPGSTLERPQSDVDQGERTKGGAFDYQKVAEGGATMDYETRMKTFHHVKGSHPVMSFGGRPHGGPLNR